MGFLREIFSTVVKFDFSKFKYVFVLFVFIAQSKLLVIWGQFHVLNYYQTADKASCSKTHFIESASSECRACNDVLRSTN